MKPSPKPAVTAATTLAALALAALGACGSATSPAAPSDATPRLQGSVTVLAAASLTESFDTLKADFEKAHPGVTVEVSYGSSATLVQQVNQGAPADLVAVAGEAAAEPLDTKLVTGSVVFASNVLEIAVPPSNPGKVADVNDLGRPGLKVVLCGETVPCGRAADAMFKIARIVPSVVSREVDVKATLAKVRLGEADAAVVYHSDVVAAKDSVSGVAIREPFNQRLRYPLLTIGTADAATAAFAGFVSSTRGSTVLTSFGFGAP